MILITTLKYTASHANIVGLMAGLLLLSQDAVYAASFTPTVFATGAAVNATSPDSITYGAGSIWVSYTNGAPSSNYTGNSTVVRYSPSGVVQKTFSFGGNVDGLKYNPGTGIVWVLQNQDGNSQLSTIDPSTSLMSTYMYPSPVSASRGFDDVAFLGNNVYLSQTNPTSASDAVVVKLNNSTPAAPLSFSTILTGTGIKATDPDSLKSTPSGGLILTGEGDKALTFITNPGTGLQTANSIALTGAGGLTIGSPDDAIYATAAAGTFYVTDSSTNTVYAINGSGLSPNSSLFVSVGNVFGSVDPTSGVVTPILNGTGLHGVEFVAAPEPASISMALAGAGMLVLAGRRRRRAA